MKVSKHCYPGSEGKYRCVKKKKKKANCKGWVTNSRALVSVSPPHHSLSSTKTSCNFFFFFCIMRAILEQVNSIHLFGEFVLKMWVQ